MLLVNPPRVLGDERQLEELAQSANDGNTADVCLVVQRAEELLVRDAANERFRRGWIAHVSALTFNLAIGAVLGFGLGHWRAAALQAATRIAISETQILTHPAGTIDALTRYRAGELHMVADDARDGRVMISWSLLTSGSQLLFTMHF